MTIASAGSSTRPRTLRLWPGIVLVSVQWAAWLAVPYFYPDGAIVGVLAGLAAGPLLLLWWMFVSRAPWSERLGALAAVVAGILATPPLLHKSVAQGNVGIQFYLYAIPVLSLTFVVWALVSRRLSGRLRLWTMVATILLTCGAFALLRSNGLNGNGSAQFAFRWSETAEQRLLAQADDEPLAQPPPPNAVDSPADWPGFRGPQRNATLPGVRLATDWSASPPKELWRRPIGPGVSSFAAGAGLLYTQEQRGEEEIVSCYKIDSGEPVWSHSDPARYWDSYVDVGPRATPTLRQGRLYTLGATGILNVLNARDGSVVWSRNAADDTKAELPTWGFVSSPLVLDDLAIVHTNALVAYDRATGERRWTGPASLSCGSPRLLTLDGIPQIVLLSKGAISVSPTDGTLLWQHSWPGIGILEPALTSDGDLVISMIDSSAIPLGTRRIAVTHKDGTWATEERWTSRGLKPSFSPLVIHKGHVFGFDGAILACIDVADGQRKWKGGRYGSGQLFLLPDQDLLLVLTEKGDLALVRANPDQFTELARVPAIHGKTWSEPALVGDVLLVRNGQEMAAFRLSLAGG